MSERGENQDDLVQRILTACDAAVKEWSLTWCDIIGCLECAKHEVWAMIEGDDHE